MKKLGLVLAMVSGLAACNPQQQGEGILATVVGGAILCGFAEVC